MSKRTKLGLALEEGMREAVAWKRGEIELEVRTIELMTPKRVKAIRKSVAKSPREFERRFGVPARTIEGWEQGKKVDVAARVLLTVIEKEPEAVERALLASG
ncbi:MAG: transcriptional regulator [Alphaproteobacteria bacterium]|nr:transcriptional regulator [Alphaproteobacteria bacterium]MDE2164094.1 transcriptional regulator [Alphaproteobacteria bacterium]